MISPISRSQLKRIESEVAREFNYSGFLGVCSVANGSGIAIQAGSHYRFINKNSLDAQGICYLQQTEKVLREAISEEILSWV